MAGSKRGDTDIEGVRVVPLKLVSNRRGHLMEVQRCDDPIYPGFGQVYITSTPPDVIKAWYRHKTQTDQIALVKGRLKLVLFDNRKSSSTCSHCREIIMEETAPTLVQIPPGVWHGFQAIGADPAYLLHLNSVAFDFDSPDEERIAPDDTSIPYSW
jgi:dTDP-4-dehydrorhamnose 3,5-epimerase